MLLYLFRVLVLYAGVFLLFGNSYIFADEAFSDSSSIPYTTLKKIVVTANKNDRLMESSQSLVIINSEKWVGTSKSIADVIAEQAGIQTRKYGGTGSFQTVSIRGMQGLNVLVLLDGIPLNSAMGGAVDLSIINPNRVGSIKIYKGITPSYFGGNSIGGVISLKSKSKNKKNMSVSSSFGAYGYKSTSVSAGNNFGKTLNVNMLADYTHSNNNWSYLDRNNTPYNKNDDVFRTVKNHKYNAYNAMLQTGLNVAGGGLLNTSVALSTSSQGIPADEGRVNRTAKYDKNMIDITSKYEKDGLLVIPQVGLLYKEENNFWTNLDQSMGVSLGSLTNSDSSYGKTDFVLRTAYVALRSKLLSTERVGVNTFLNFQHSDVESRTYAMGNIYGDWPGATQKINFATDVNYSIPIKSFKLGAVIGASTTVLRDKTQGGKSEISLITVPARDTIDVSWAVNGGVNARYKKLSTFFFNAGRYSRLPSLRERYGTKGRVKPNPNLKEETGIQIEIGHKLSDNGFFVETVFFYTEKNDGIFFLSDGNMSMPVNVGGARNYGLEWTFSGSVLKRVNTAIKGVWQKTQNRSHVNNWYLNKMPNEPELSLLGEIVFCPFYGAKIKYWADFKSPFYRDFGNTEGQLVPEQSQNNKIINGLLFHNIMAEWRMLKYLKCRVSARNISNISMRYEEVTQTIEGGYSWVLYPSNEWNVFLVYSF